MKGVNSPRLKLLYDIYHHADHGWRCYQDDLRQLRTFRALSHGRVPSRHEIDDTQELNYPMVMQAIADLGLCGYVALELPKGDPFAAMQKAHQNCDV